jgi:hypothetical protein
MEYLMPNTRHATSVFTIVGAMLVAAAFFRVVVAQTPTPIPTPIPTATFGAVGSWFGKAMQVCPTGVAPAACANGQPAGALLMTLVMTGDGRFVADDSTTLLSAPFGPHSTAVGSWTPTSDTEFTAEYIFMANAYPPPIGGVYVQGLRARWQATVIDADTVVGWVNAYFQSTPVPVRWSALALDGDFPELPVESLGFVTPPGDFIKNPSLCRTAACPQVFKFRIKRVRR